MPTFNAGDTLTISLGTDDRLTFDGAGRYTCTLANGTVTTGTLTGRQYLGAFQQTASISIFATAGGTYSVAYQRDLTDHIEDHRAMAAGGSLITDTELSAQLAGLGVAVLRPSGDQTGATDPAAAAALFLNYPVVKLVPGATYYGNFTLNDKNFLICQGQAAAFVIGTDKSKPVIDRTNLTGVAGLDISVRGYSLSDALPLSIGMRFTTSQSTSFTENCYIHNVSSCLYSLGSFVYSNTFSNLQLGRFGHSAVYFNCVGATGNLFQNIYAQNWDAYPSSKVTLAGQAFQFTGSHDETIMNQLNIEWVKAQAGILLNGCNNFAIKSLHYEGYEANNNYGALIQIVNSNASIDSWTVKDCKFDGAVAANYALVSFTVSGGIQSKLALTQYKDLDCTVVNSPTRNRFFRAGTTTSTPDPIIWVNGYESPVFGVSDYMPQNGNDPQVQYGMGAVVAASAWNGTKTLTLGSYKFWVDSSGRLRIKNGTPTSDTDGAVVGTQT